MKYETCHSPVVKDGLCWPVDHCQFNVVLWLHSATCWLYSVNTVAIKVKVPLVDSGDRRRILQPECLFDGFSFPDKTKVECGAGQGHLRTWTQI